MDRRGQEGREKGRRERGREKGKWKGEVVDLGGGRGDNSDAGDGGSGRDSCKVEYERITNLGLKPSVLKKCQIDQRGLNQREAV